MNEQQKQTELRESFKKETSKQIETTITAELKCYSCDEIVESETNVWSDDYVFWLENQVIKNNKSKDWISVDDKLPGMYTLVLIKKETGDTALTYRDKYKDGFIKWNLIPHSIKVTHWKYVNFN